MPPRDHPTMSDEFAVSTLTNGVPAHSSSPPVAVPTVSSYHSWWRYVKRGFDIAVVLVALVPILPLVVLISVAVMISSPGNPFFLQDRIGRGGRTFKCIKFRTMHPNAEERLRADPGLHGRYLANDFKLGAHEDPRVFRVGRFLRRTSLDELPQLSNVLIGHMSLVGPRPVVPAELDRYGVWKGAYLAMRPGITGCWQINGRSHIRYPQRAQLDAEYLDQWRFGTDFIIILKTIPSVLRRRGAS